MNEQFRTIAGSQQGAGMNMAGGMGYQGGRQQQQRYEDFPRLNLSQSLILVMSTIEWAVRVAFPIIVMLVIDNSTLNSNNNVVIIITIKQHADRIISQVGTAIVDVEASVEIYIEVERRVMPVLAVSWMSKENLFLFHCSSLSDVQTKPESVAMQHHRLSVPRENIVTGRHRSRANNSKRLATVLTVWFSRRHYREVLVDEAVDADGSAVDPHYRIVKVRIWTFAFSLPPNQIIDRMHSLVRYFNISMLAVLFTETLPKKDCSPSILCF